MPEIALGILDALHHRPVAGDHHLLQLIRGVLDVDDLAHHDGRLKAAFGAIALRGGGVELLDHQVLTVGERVGEAPGDALVVTDDHQGEPGERHPNAVEVVSSPDVSRVPDRGDAGRQVRVVAQDGPACGGAAATHHPGVAAAPRPRDPAGGLLEHGQHPVAGLARPGRRPGLLQDQRVGAGVHEIEAGGLPRTDGAEQLEALQLGVPVEAQPQGQQLGGADAVHRLPGLRRHPQQAELQGQTPRALDDRVDPGGVRLERGPSLLAEAGQLLVGDAHQAETADESVHGYALGAGELADPAGGHAAGDLQLPEAVLGVGHSHGERRVRE